MNQVTRHRSRRIAFCGAALLLASCDAPYGGEGFDDSIGTVSSALNSASNPYGLAETFHTSGAIDRTNPFFLAVGVNPRTCETCHAADQGWTLTSAATKELFQATDGLAPLFLPHDAGNRPDAVLTTLADRRAAFKATLVKKGLIRFGRTVPATANFTVTSVFDPAGFALPTRLTNFRRPTPVSNEAKVASILWTGVQADVPAALPGIFSAGATFHEQRVGAPPPEMGLAARDFQLGLFFAQIFDNDAGRLDAGGALGGPTNLAAQPFHVGINDIQGLDPAGQSFNRKVFNLFDAWAVYAGAHDHHSDDGCDQGGEDDDIPHSYSCDYHGTQLAARAAIYRGQELFNFREFDVRDVHGLNDVLGQTVVRATCSTCHNVPNVGGHAVIRMFDVGTADTPNCSEDLPLLTLAHTGTTDTRQTCDMGRGGNGVWADVGSFRAPPLRGLAARGPYFHDGQAKTLRKVVRYFDQRFSIGLTKHQKRDLEAFLGAL